MPPPIDVVNETKLLGTIITSDLKWDSNTNNIVKRANARMSLLRQLSKFKPKLEDMKIIYISYIRSILEQSCQVWHFSLTKENSEDLERVQKNALKIVLGNKYIDYESSLNELNLQTLYVGRESLCLQFAQNTLKIARQQIYFLKIK